MKTIYITLIVILSFTVVNAQEVVVTLSGNTSGQGFSVKDNLDNTLFRVRGDGSFGFGTALPLGVFDIIGGTMNSGTAKAINILGQNTNEVSASAFGGDINIKSGWGQTNGGSINIETQKDAGNPSGSENPGTINIKTTTGDVTGGINLITGTASGISGDIKIQTGLTDGFCGDIELQCGNSVSGEQGGNILLIAGGNDASGQAGIVSITSGYGFGSDGGKLDLSAGNSSDASGGDVNITAGNANYGGNGGDIILNPGISSEGVDGTVIINGSGCYSGTWVACSDIRFKQDIKPLHNSIDKIEQLNGVSYELRKDEFPEKNFDDGRQIGLIAQNVEKVFPELVKTDSEGYKAVAYQNMVAVLIEAIKEQQSSIEELKKEVELLKTSMNNKVIEVSSLGN